MDNAVLLSALRSKNKELVKLNLETFCYSYYKDTVNKFKNNIDIDVEELKLVLRCLEFIYAEGEISPLSDSEYDELHNIYNSLTNNVITDEYPITGKKAVHLYPELKGTINKVHYIRESDKDSNSVKTHKSIEAWLKSSFKTIFEHSKPEMKLQFVPKFDGVSVIFAFEFDPETKSQKLISAITRGDKETNEGRDITYNFINRNVESIIPEKFAKEQKIGIKTEVCMSKSNFLEYSEKYRTESRKLTDPRSAISGIITAERIPDEFYKYITIKVLEFSVNNEISFPDSGYVFKLKYSDNIDINDIFKEVKVSSKKALSLLDVLESKITLMNQITEYISKLSKEIECLDVNCDGIVIRFIDKRSQEILGRDYENSVNKFEVAYKFPPEEKITTLLGVNFQVGLLGNITPVAKVKPVILKNKIIKSISLGSMDRLKTLNLRIGDDVLVKYEIIPYLDKPYETKNNLNPIIEPPTTCPCCGEPIDTSNSYYICTNNKCPSRIIGKINNYCEKMNIKGIGPAIIEILFNKNILTSIKDLYDLKKHKDEIVDIDGFGLLKYHNLISAVKSIDRISPDILLGAIGIRSIGRSKFNKILSIYNINELLELDNDQETINKLSGVPGIGNNTAIQILEGIQENKDLIEFLMSKIKLIEKKGEMYNIVFSGIRNREFAKYLESIGFEIKESVNKKTKAVIVPDKNTDTIKVEKAKEMGIPIIDLISAYGLFNYKKEK